MTQGVFVRLTLAKSCSNQAELIRLSESLNELLHNKLFVRLLTYLIAKVGYFERCPRVIGLGIDRDKVYIGVIKAVPHVCLRLTLHCRSSDIVKLLRTRDSHFAALSEPESNVVGHKVRRVVLTFRVLTAVFVISREYHVRNDRGCRFHQVEPHVPDGLIKLWIG